MSDTHDPQPNPAQETQRITRIPAEAARAANVILDALIAQHASSDPETNQRAYEIALEPLSQPATQLDAGIDDSHVFGAAMVNQAWLASQLAIATGSDLESVIAGLREYLRSIGD